MPANVEQTPGSMEFGGSTFILMNNEEDLKRRSGHSFAIETKEMRISGKEPMEHGSSFNKESE
jgi:hypothetical protein